MSCGVGHRHSSDPALLWLWCGPVAVALIGPIAWEPPYAVGMALKKDKTNKKHWQDLSLLYKRDQTSHKCRDSFC